MQLFVDCNLIRNNNWIFLWPAFNWELPLVENINNFLSLHIRKKILLHIDEKRLEISSIIAPSISDLDVKRSQKLASKWLHICTSSPVEMKMNKVLLCCVAYSMISTSLKHIYTERLNGFSVPFFPPELLQLFSCVWRAKSHSTPFTLARSHRIYFSLFRKWC